MWPVPLNGTLGNALSGAVFCQVSIQIKRAGGQMAWSGACLGAGMAPSFTPLASCAHRARQPPRTWHLFVPRPWGWMGTLAKWTSLAESLLETGRRGEQHGARGSDGARVLPRPQPSGPSGQHSWAGRGLPSVPFQGDVGLLGTPPLPRRLQPPCMRPKPFSFVISLFLKKKNEILQR